MIKRAWRKSVELLLSGRHTEISTVMEASMVIRPWSNCSRLRRKALDGNRS